MAKHPYTAVARCSQHWRNLRMKMPSYHSCFRRLKIRIGIRMSLPRPSMPCWSHKYPITRQISKKISSIKKSSSMRSRVILRRRRPSWRPKSKNCRLKLMRLKRSTSGRLNRYRKQKSLSPKTISNRLRSSSSKSKRISRRALGNYSQVIMIMMTINRFKMRSRSTKTKKIRLKRLKI